MTTASDPVAAALAGVMQADRGRILSALVARTGDFQLAEDALQEALAAALLHWTRADIPQNPMAWLIRVAFRKAIDRLRSAARDSRTAAALAVLAHDEAEDEAEDIPDERLRLIFTCCHPALEPKSQVALTLRTLGGLSTAEIARAFLDTEATMGQRLTRAKAKIAAAGIAFAVPGPDLWAERLASVLAVIYLIFNAGYTADPAEPGDLCSEAIFLARLLAALRPGDAEIEGCLALLLITHARHAARIDADGATVALADQNRQLWDYSAIAEGLSLITQAMARRAPGPYQIKAAIAACHVRGTTPDWAQIVLLYGSLLRHEPTPVVQLNRAVALAENGQLPAALDLLSSLAGVLDAYQPFHATMAELLARNGNQPEAGAAYDKAIDLSVTAPERAFLAHKRSQLGGGQKKGRA